MLASLSNDITTSIINRFSLIPSNLLVQGANLPQVVASNIIETLNTQVTPLQQSEMSSLSQADMESLMENFLGNSIAYFCTHNKKIIGDVATFANKVATLVLTYNASPTTPNVATSSIVVTPIVVSPKSSTVSHITQAVKSNVSSSHCRSYHHIILSIIGTICVVLTLLIIWGLVHHKEKDIPI